MLLILILQLENPLGKMSQSGQPGNPIVQSGEIGEITLLVTLSPLNNMGR